MSRISKFPEFSPISLKQREEISSFLREYPPLASEYSFTNLFAWRHSYEYKVSAFGNGFLFLKEKPVRAFLQPLVPEAPLTAMKECFAFLGKGGKIERVGEDFLASLGTVSDISAKPERSHFDYLYNSLEMRTLPGKRFHDKKNLVAQFEKKYSFQYTPLQEKLIGECIAFKHSWCMERNCEDQEGLKQEHCAVLEMLRNFSALKGLRGGILRVNGIIVALTLGEELNKDTLVIHVEKANTRFSGIYQKIFKEFVQAEGENYRFVNREQDLGVPGLRRAKQSYNPVTMIKKYTLSLKE
jgi:hypothetical protein